jgi:hypothetical protein
MDASLADPTAEILQESPTYGHSDKPVPETIGYREAVMRAVCTGRPDATERAMTTLLSDVRTQAGVKAVSPGRTARRGRPAVGCRSR